MTTDLKLIQKGQKGAKKGSSWKLFKLSKSGENFVKAKKE